MFKDFYAFQMQSSGCSCLALYFTVSLNSASEHRTFLFHALTPGRHMNNFMPTFDPRSDFEYLYPRTRTQCVWILVLRQVYFQFFSF